MSTLKPGSAGSAFRSRILFHATAQSIGCPPKPSSMANYWHTLRPWHDSVSLWRSMRSGAKPWLHNQKFLFDHFPHLRALYDNPLFTFVFHPEWSGEWDDLADSIRIGGEPLDGYNGKLTRLLYDRVDWPSLAVHLVLYQTHAPRFCSHRLWLKDNLLAMVRLSGMQRPISFVRSEFYDFLTPIILGGDASQSNWQSRVAKWMPSEDLFNCLQQGQWLHGDDQALAMLIWNFREELQSELDIGPQQPLGEESCGVPRSLQKKWCRKLAQWRDHPLSLNGICCEYTHQ
ncbi:MULTISPECIES: hypothetical protein [unclassified Pseudomonas]|uniref:hypothetical protein n=1 Tax=unclassified Pseudomonas TaxID=196821 RepID=UPI00257FDF6E|nr:MULTISPECIES: hypothetical protein [unclassified Pseudomonas]